MLQAYRNENGSAMVLIIFITAALFLLGTSLLGQSMTDFKIALNEEKSAQAFYVAEAGIEVAQKILQCDLDFRDDLAADFGPGRFEVAFEELEDQKLSIVSTGIVENARETVTLTLILMTGSSSFSAPDGGV